MRVCAFCSSMELEIWNAKYRFSGELASNLRGNLEVFGGLTRQEHNYTSGGKTITQIGLSERSH
jgi:hypothetical protein